MIHVICGPPCSGKSTYVREHAQDGDVLVDYDAIAQALGQKESHKARIAATDQNIAAFIARRAVIEWACEHSDEVESWVIHTEPTSEQMDAYAACSSEIVTLGTDMETCLARCEADGRPPGTQEAIREWFANREQAPKGAFLMPAKGGAMETKTKTVDIEKANTTMEADDNGSITGYAATWTREPDSYGDVIAKGAFAESIAAIDESGKSIPLLWNHNSNDLGAYIGTVSALTEDDHGLLFTASFDSTDEAQRARELASDGRLCKFSFAYDVLDQMEVELEEGRKANELRKLDIHEVSLVMYPANRDTSVVEVKSAPEPEEKAGRRNSKADEYALRSALEHIAALETIVNGLIGDEADEPDEQEPEPEAEGAEAKSEEPDTANDEEPQAKSAEDEETLKYVSEVLGTEV